MRISDWSSDVCSSDLPDSEGLSMRIDKLTSRFQQALADAQSLAVGRDHNLIEPTHLLLALLDQSGGGPPPLHAPAGVNVPELRELLSAPLDKLRKVRGKAGQVWVGNGIGRASVRER